MNVPTNMPTEKEGEKIAKILDRLEGFEISEARILLSTPHGPRPTVLDQPLRHDIAVDDEAHAWPARRSRARPLC